MIVENINSSKTNLFEYYIKNIYDLIICYINIIVNKIKTYLFYYPLFLVKQILSKQSININKIKLNFIMKYFSY